MKYFLVIASILAVVAMPWHYTVATSKPINLVAASTNKSGYPAIWANAPLDSLVDSWGQSNRECGSYAAYMIYKTYGFSLNKTWGVDWVSAAQKRGIPVDNKPSAGSVAYYQNQAGTSSHVMWVDSYDAKNNLIHISEYNWNGDGKFHQRILTPTWQFIHFDQVKDFKTVPLYN